jgi:hypothetical protein
MTRMSRIQKIKSKSRHAVERGGFLLKIGGAGSWNPLGDGTLLAIEVNRPYLYY